jgi:L-threonylcarbamoyladenylate synthase
VRPETKGIPILLAGLDDLHLVVREINLLAAALAQAFWPGPLTLVLPKNPCLPPAVSQTDTVAVRAPDHSVFQTLVKTVGAPLATTSANISGQPPTTDPEIVLQTLGGRIAAILDGGLTPGGVPSTIVDCTTLPPRILRPGPITKEQVMAVAKRIKDSPC